MNIEHLIITFGYVGLFGVIFAESGLLIGFFLPGDSVLFTAGFLASQHVFSLPVLIAVCLIAAVTGDSVGYMFGRRFGKKLFQKEDSLFFHKSHVLKAQEFYKKHGPKTIVIARFIPVVRTFAPIVAGIAEMEYSTFVTYNVVGGLLWATGLNLAGFYLGQLIPNVDKYLLPIIALIIFVSVAPTLVHIWKDEEMRGHIKKAPRHVINHFSKKK